MKPIGEEDRALIAAAVAKAEAASDGEIVTIVAPRSDAYHDVALHYAVLLMLFVPAFWAFAPQSLVDCAAGLVLGWNAELNRELVMLYIFVKLAGAFLVVRIVLAYQPLRMALTPGRTKIAPGPSPRGRTVPRQLRAEDARPHRRPPLSLARRAAGRDRRRRGDRLPGRARSLGRGDGGPDRGGEAGPARPRHGGRGREDRRRPRSRSCRPRPTIRTNCPTA